MNSFTEENYLKAIYTLTEQSNSVVSTNAIAEKMNTKAASVTDMLKKLSDKKLINYQKYQGGALSSKGKKVALSIIRKHRLWEMFLLEKLDFKWDEVHDVAEQLEHINSDKLIAQIDKFLNYPKFDPHGEPIPDANGKIQQQRSKSMANYKKNDVLLMTGVVDHSTSFLNYIDKSGLALGNEIRIKDVNEFDRSLQITIGKKNTIFISNDVAKNILAIIK